MALQSMNLDDKMVIQEVARGCEIASQLQSLLRLSPRCDGLTELAEVLSEEVLSSLAMALSILKPPDRMESVASETESTMAYGNLASHDHAHFGSKVMTPGNLVQGKARRSREPLESWTIVTSIPYHDGHEWRKYGQKKIHRAKFPRCYYKCTHYDKGCPATKQVQQQDSCDDLPMFNVTYNKQHTCNNSGISAKPLVRDSAPIEPGLTDYNGIIKQEGILLSTSPSGNRDFAGELMNRCKTSSTPSDDSTSSDLTTIESRAMAGDMSFDYDMLMDSLGHGNDLGLDDYYL